MPYAWAVWIVDEEKLAYLMSKGPDGLQHSLILSCGVGESQWDGLDWFQENGCLIITPITISGELYTHLEVQVPCTELSREVEAWLSPECLDGPGNSYEPNGKSIKGEAYAWGLKKAAAA
jgi:hypothetical protein